MNLSGLSVLGTTENTKVFFLPPNISGHVAVIYSLITHRVFRFFYTIRCNEFCVSHQVQELRSTNC